MGRVGEMECNQQSSITNFTNGTQKTAITFNNKEIRKGYEFEARKAHAVLQRVLIIDYGRVTVTFWHCNQQSK